MLKKCHQTCPEQIYKGNVYPRGKLVNDVTIWNLHAIWTKHRKFSKTDNCDFLSSLLHCLKNFHYFASWKLQFSFFLSCLFNFHFLSLFACGHFCMKHSTFFLSYFGFGLGHWMHSNAPTVLTHLYPSSHDSGSSSHSLMSDWERKKLILLDEIGLRAQKN